MPINRTENGVPPAKFIPIVKYITKNTTIASMAYETVELSPPAGKSWRVLNMYLFASKPTGATVGAHAFSLILGDINVLYGESVFNSDLKWDYSRWDLADSVQKPDTDIASQQALISTYFTKKTPLYVKQFNNTDVPQTRIRYILMSMIESPLI